MGNANCLSGKPPGATSVSIFKIENELPFELMLDSGFSCSEVCACRSKHLGFAARNGAFLLAPSECIHSGSNDCIAFSKRETTPPAKLSEEGEVTVRYVSCNHDFSLCINAKTTPDTKATPISEREQEDEMEAGCGRVEMEVTTSGELSKSVKWSLDEHGHSGRLQGSRTLVLRPDFSTW